MLMRSLAIAAPRLCDTFSRYVELNRALELRVPFRFPPRGQLVLKGREGHRAPTFAQPRHSAVWIDAIRPHCIFCLANTVGSDGDFLFFFNSGAVSNTSARHRIERSMRSVTARQCGPKNASR
jgi:hypothetical protein